MDKKHKFDIENPDFYEYMKPKERTRKRLTEMADLGMEEVGIAQFGYKGAMSGLYIEKVWYYDDQNFSDYMNYVRSLIYKHIIKQILTKLQSVQRVKIFEIYGIIININQDPDGDYVPFCEIEDIIKQFSINQ